MFIEESEQRSIIELMDRYKRLHDEITRIEVTIKDVENDLRTLLKSKDSVVDGITKNREKEHQLILELTKKYGDGKLNVQNFEWIKTKENGMDVKDI